MPSAESIQPDSRSLSLLIGRSGSGKTAAALSFPHPIDVLDLDGRIRGGLACPWIVRKDIYYDYYPSKPSKGTTFEAINKRLDAIQAMALQQQYAYKTLLVDSATWFCNDMILDALPMTHTARTGGGESGRTLGTLNMAGPSDYGFQSTATLQLLAFLKSLPIPHIVVTAHIVNRWGRRKNEEGKVIDPYGPTEIVGEQLALTDKIAETLPSMFDNVFRFEKQDTGSKLKFFFSAHGELERTAFPNLPYGNFDITDKDFYSFLMSKVQTPTATTAGAAATFATPI